MYTNKGNIRVGIPFFGKYIYFRRDYFFVLILIENGDNTELKTRMIEYAKEHVI